DEGWVRRGVARRLTLDDPAELGRFLSMHARVAFLWHGECHDIDECARVFDVLRALSARDTESSHGLVGEGTFPLKGSYRDAVLVYNGVFALLRKDAAFLRSFKPAPSRRTNRWFRAIYVCLRGIVEKSPELVAEGLDKLLGARSIWNWEELKVICLEAHG